ncbi:MAG TPA: hypothetical protein VN948_22205 [Terriglobales bacterium]|nr:hypothetical protein [Terriglobales bacterium]
MPVDTINREEAWKVLCNSYRDALFNEKIYTNRLIHTRTRNKIANLIIASAATGSPFLALGIWQNPTGKIVLTVFTSVVAVTAWINNHLDWPHDLQRYSRLHEGFQNAAFALLQLIQRIQLGSVFDKPFWASYEKLAQHAVELARDGDLQIPADLAARLKAEVISESDSVLGRKTNETTH